jgi:hypothetical protein
MSHLNKFFPNGQQKSRYYKAADGYKEREVTNTNLLQQKKDELISAGIDPDDPGQIYDLWEKMGSPSATIIMCGYKISNGMIVK